MPDLEKIRELGLPFWLAGSYGAPGKLAEAKALGACGVQVGTAFASCEESGIAPDLKARVIALSREGQARVFTDPVASPTGFPFKVLQVEGTLSDPQTSTTRGSGSATWATCAMPTAESDGSLGYRCPAEPVETYVRKGGTEAERGRPQVRLQRVAGGHRPGPHR